MARVKRIGLSVFMAVALCLALCPAMAFAAPLGAATVNGSDSGSVLQAQAGKNMKARGVLFNLKADKTVTYYCYFKGVGKISHTATVSGLKVRTKNGVKTATFTITHKLAKNLTSSQVKKMHKALKKYGTLDNIGAYKWNHFIDYTTGRTIENPKSVTGVTWEKLNNKFVSTKTYTSSDGAWFSLAKKWTAKYKITYPETYKGLCIGVGGSDTAYNDMSAADRGYVSATDVKYTYYKTSFFKGDIKNTHFMRVTL